MPRRDIPSKKVSSMATCFALFLLLVQPRGLLADQPHELHDQQDQAMRHLAGLAAQLLQGHDASTAGMDVEAGASGMDMDMGLSLDVGTGRTLSGLGASSVGGNMFRAAAHELEYGLRQAAGFDNTEFDFWNLFRRTNASDMFRQSSDSSTGWFDSDIMNITDWASRIPSASQMIRFIRNPVGSLAPEPLSADVQAMLDSNQAEAVFILALLSAIFNLVSSIFYILSGGLGTMAASLGLIPAALGLVTVPLGVGLSADTLLLTISQNEKDRYEDWNQKFYKAWTSALARLGNALANLNDGPLRAQLAQYRKQLQEAADVLQTAYQRNYTQRFQAQFPVAAQVAAAARARAQNLRG